MARARLQGPVPLTAARHSVPQTTSIVAQARVPSGARCLFDAFASREPVSTSLENALDWHYARKNSFHK